MCFWTASGAWLVRCWPSVDAASCSSLQSLWLAQVWPKDQSQDRKCQRLVKHLSVSCCGGLAAAALVGGSLKFCLSEGSFIGIAMDLSVLIPCLVDSCADFDMECFLAWTLGICNCGGCSCGSGV